MYLPERGWKRFFVLLVFLLLGGLALFYAWKHLFIVVIPLILAWILAHFLQKPVDFLKQKLKIPKKLSSIVFILLVISLISGALFLLFDKLVEEMEGLYSFIKNNSDSIASSFNSTLDNIKKSFAKFPFAKYMNSQGFSTKLRETATNALLSIVSNGIEKAPKFLSNFVSILPDMLVFFVIFLFSAYYLTSDFVKINSFVVSQCNEKVTHILRETKAIFFNVLSKFIKAYFILFLITFALLFIGFVLMGLEFAFVLALTVAIIDLLPILGSGTVLIPWSIICLVIGNYAMAIKTIVLYLVITFSRQALQPRIIGDFVGLHPLASLISMFLGYAVMGVAGMFIFPLALIIIKTMNDKGTIHLWKNPPKDDTTPKKRK